MLFVKSAKGLASFGDRRPGLVGAGRMGDKAAGRNGDLTVVRGLSLGHAKAAGLFCRGGKLRWYLGVSVSQWPAQEAQTEDKKSTPRQHARIVA